MSALYEPFDDVMPDEPRSAENENVHDAAPAGRST
jgi:hypothetical protein